MASRGEAWQPRELWREKSTSLRARRKHTERFPATCARFYDRLLRNVFLYVFGIYVDRKSEILPGVSPGIVKGDGHGFVGFIRALFNATEAQGSLSLSPLHLPTKAREGKIVVLLLTLLISHSSLRTLSPRIYRSALLAHDRNPLHLPPLICMHDEQAEGIFTDIFFFGACTALCFYHDTPAIQTTLPSCRHTLTASAPACWTRSCPSRANSK